MLVEAEDDLPDYKRSTVWELLRLIYVAQNWRKRTRH